MSMTPEQIAALANAAAEQEDQSETTAGGDFEYTIPGEGTTVGRMVEYIELGKQPQKPYLGKAKPDCEKVRITFELTHPSRVKEVDKEDGTKIKIAERISLTLTKKFGEKARFKKLFNAMAYGRSEIKHMAQMLGEAFIIRIVHNKSEDGKNTYANIENDSGWLVSAPFKVDPIEETKIDLRSKIPLAINDIKAFFFNMPTKEAWASLFIEGTRTVKVDGVEKEVSKNWLQELIISAKNFKGSPLDIMLSDVDVEAAEKEVESLKNGSAEDALAELDSKNSGASNDDLAALGLEGM